MKPLMGELRRLKPMLLEAPRNRPFVEHHRARLSAERPELSAFAVDTKVFSLLVSTREHEILAMCVRTVRRVNRETSGAAVYDALPVEARHCGALIYDGHMAELQGGIDPKTAVAVVNSELSAKGLEYEVALKPNFGRQNEEVASATEGRAALRDATSAYPTVRDAVVSAQIEAIVHGNEAPAVISDPYCEDAAGVAPATSDPYSDRELQDLELLLDEAPA